MYFMKALRVEHIKSKRTMLNIIPFALSLIVKNYYRPKYNPLTRASINFDGWAQPEW